MTRVYSRLLGLGLVALLIAACGSSESGQNDAAATQAATDRSNARHFVTVDIDGATRQSAEWIGNGPVVLNFWGTWCPPCRREIPDLVKLYAEYEPKGIEILGLAVQDSPEKVRRYADASGMNWVMLMADPEIQYLYGATRGVPTTVFLDKDGNEVRRFLGPPTYQQFKEAFEAIL